MKKMSILLVLGVMLLTLGSTAMAIDVTGSLTANTNQEYKVSLTEGVYTVNFSAPGKGWVANVTYICHA